MKDISMMVSKQTNPMDPTTDRNDFMAEDEITITITLHEYRELVRENALNFACNHENGELRKQLDKANETAEWFRHMVEIKEEHIKELEDFLHEPVFTTEVPFESEEKDA